MKKLQILLLGSYLVSRLVFLIACEYQKAISRQIAKPSIAAQISADMLAHGEGLPHGVPLSYEWRNTPVLIMGNNSSGWKAITAWGAIYEDSKGNPATNTRVNIREMRLYLLRKASQKWVLLQDTSTPIGAAYREDFAGDINQVADIRREPDGTISVTAGRGYNFHFFPASRASLDCADIGGIVMVLQARLITGDPTKPDDRRSARYLCSGGADYYPAITGSWPGNASFNPGVAIGKFKYVRNEWRSFAMTTLTKAQLERNPPPIDLNGVLP